MAGIVISGWQDLLPYLVEQVERIPPASWVGILTFAGAMIVMWRNNVQQVKRLRMQLEAEKERHEQRLAHEAEGRKLSHEHDTARLQAQLGHDAQQRDLERMHTMRSEVYLEQLARLSSASFRLIKDAHSGDAAKAFDEMQDAVARIAIVCGEKTRTIASDLSRLYSPVAKLAIESSAKVAVAKAYVNKHEKLVDLFTERHAEIAAKLKSVTGEPQTKTRDLQIGMLEEQQKFFWEKLEKERAALLAALEDERKASVEAIDRVGDALIPVHERLEDLRQSIAMELGIDSVPNA